MVTKKKQDALEFLESVTGGPLTIGSFLEAIRLGEDMTQPHFAKILGISKSHLNDIEKGRKVVSAGRAAYFAEILGYSKKQFVRLSLQAILDHEGIKMKVSVQAA